MTKADLIDAVAAEAQISKRQAGAVIEHILDEIKLALKRGERVVLAPFGSFVVRSRKAREGRNPKTGQTIMIRARNVPAFIAGKSLRDAVGGTARRANHEGRRSPGSGL